MCHRAESRTIVATIGGDDNFDVFEYIVSKFVALSAYINGAPGAPAYARSVS